MNTQMPGRTSISVKPIKDYLTHLALALAALAGLAAGDARALTTTQTFDLGTSPAGTAFATGHENSLFVWIAKGSLPAGSILRSVTATNIKLEANPGDNYTGDIGVAIDPSPETLGGADNLLTINDENGAGAFGGIVHTDWAGQGYTYSPFSATVSAPINFPATIDLHDGAVMLGSSYGAGTYSGTITLEYDVVAAATFVTFGPNAAVGELVGHAAAIAWTVPYGSDVTALAPTFTLSSGTCDKVSGETHNFTNPVVYTVTDGATVNTYTVTVTVAPDEATLLWNAGSGAWDFSTPNWKGQLSGVSMPFFNGKNVIFDQPAGGTVTLVSGIQPLSTTVNSSGNYAFGGSPLGGTGALTKSGSGGLTISGQQDNTYSGGTVINAGQLYLFDVQNATGLGTGPVTLNGGVLHLDRFNLSNALTVNGGSIIMDNGFGSSISGSITANVQLSIQAVYTTSQVLSGTISGPGGITLSSNAGGGLDLSGTNTYTGDTIVNGGVLQCDAPNALGRGALSISSGGAQVNLNYSGTKAIASLTLGGVAQTVFGTYGSSASGASIKNDTYFAGTGTVTVAPIITSFGIPGYAGVIDQVAKTIALTVPFGTSLATLAPTFAVTFGSCNQTSGSPPSPTFAAGNPAHYIVTSGSFHNDYAVTVTVAPASTACDILTFGLPGNAGFIDQSAKTITLNVPVSPGVTSLAPTYTVSQFATGSPPSGTTLNFTNPQAYTVTAQDGTTHKTYTVTVNTYQSWAHSGSIFILTDATGANLPGSAAETDFPLLVRFNSGNFNFGQAASDGSDIRFTTPAGTALSYEIEQWDAIAGQAAVWVKIPTITGNARQEIKVYWGKPGVASQSNGAAVFNAANGYCCVMHLNGNVLDSTGSISPVNGGATPTTAVIGGHAMNLSSGDITATNITNFPTGTNPTSSGEVWIRARQINSGWCMPLAWGNQNEYGWNTWVMQIGFWGSPTVLPAPLTCRGPATVSGTTALAAQQWYHVVYSNSNGTGKLYVNGALDATASGGAITITNPQAMSLGAAGGDADVDEARISSVVRSANWVKMEYENQKPLQTLVGTLVQDGSTFSATPPSVTMNENTTTTLSGQAGGAQKVYWCLVQNGVETVLATDQFTYTLSPGRITGNQSFVIRFKGIYPTGSQMVDIPVTVTDTIPDPVFTLSASTNPWDGRQTMTVTPVISNLAAMQAANVANLNYHWSVAGVAVSKNTTTTPGSLTLTRSQGSGPMTVTLVLDNGGALVSNSKTINVQEPASDAWVQRTPGAAEKVVSNQLIARDPNTNQGTIFYNGIQGGSPNSVFLKIYTTDTGSDVPYASYSQAPGTGGSYAFSAPINAGKVTYKVVFGTTTGGIDTIVATVTNVVCGDAYLIDGQSNALATDNVAPDDTTTTNPWIRTYGLTLGWGSAVSKGNEMQLGLWGWYLANSMVAAHNMPVCFIQGAVGGTRIDQHQPNPADHAAAGSLYSIYANIYNRVQGGNLTHGIRGVFWHQGESDSGADSPTGDWDYKSYQQYFVDMAAAWKQDFPNIQRYIIWQVMPAPCAMGPKGDQLRDVLRHLPSMFSKMHILDTLGMAGYEGCHFNPTGYQNFANLTAPLVGQDFYGVVPGMPVTAPILQRAYYTTAARTEIALQFDQNMSWNSFSTANYWLDKAGSKITSGSVSGKVVKLELTSAGTTASTLDYLEDAHWNYTESVSSLLSGANGIPALTFADVPIATSVPTSYGDWAASPAQGLTAGVNDGPLDDPDHDGIPNLLEFTLGGNPLVASRAIQPALTHVAGAWTFEYDRSNLSLPPATTQVVEYGSDLTGWTAVTIPATSGGSVTIIPGNPSDHVKVAIPMSGTRTFARLKVIQP